MKIKFNDGGRKKAGFKGSTGDCVTRAIAIASGIPYKTIYNELALLSKTFNQKGYKVRGKSHPRTGVHKKVCHKYILGLGFEWTPCMKIGQGCKVHLKADELPKGRLIVRVSKHLSAVINGTLKDTHNPTRGGTRCVYGYYKFAPKSMKVKSGYHVYLECATPTYKYVGSAKYKRDAEALGKRALREAHKNNTTSKAGKKFQNICLYKNRMIHYPIPNYIKKIK